MWWEIASTFNDWFMHDIGPGPKMLQPRVAINVRIVRHTHYTCSYKSLSSLSLRFSSSSFFVALLHLLSLYADALIFRCLFLILQIHKLGAGPFLIYILFTTELSAADSQGRHGALLAALHATYGFLWCIKDTAYPDKSWQKPSTVGSVIGLVAGQFC